MDEFDRALKELEWTRVELARRIGLAPESVSRWDAPPKYVLAYLDAMICIKHLRERTAGAHKEAKRVLGE